MKKLTWLVIFSGLTHFVFASAASASRHYTEKQLEALSARVGKTYWIVAASDHMPSFLSAPTAKAVSFQGPPNTSFEILELVGRKEKNPYYKVRFESGRQGYIPPESFHEALNLTIVTSDPQAKEKQKAAQQAEEEKKRVEWIRAQPWSQAVKDAAIKRQPVLGLTTAEVKKALGDPVRSVKAQSTQKLREEKWFYPDGSVLIFINGLLSRVESEEKKQP